MHGRNAARVLACPTDVWLVCPCLGVVTRMSTAEYAALPVGDPLLSWLAFLDEERAAKAKERTRGGRN